MSDHFFITGGTLPLDASSYVTRQADTNLLEGLHHGDFCYVLNTRQMGKSSLMVRTARTLQQEGYRVIVLDLTAIGQNLTVDQWYFGLLGKMAVQIDREEELIGYWKSHREFGPMQRLVEALRELLLREVGEHDFPGIVIFVDEIDAVRSLPFSADEFFAGIRECYNRRAHEPIFQRLTFCLLGVATPGDLIQDTRISPFNIGRRIELHDFNEREATPLKKGLSRVFAMLRSPQKVQKTQQGDAYILPPQADATDDQWAFRTLQRILYWTNGHPYMTQRLCRALVERLENERGEEGVAMVDRLCQSLFLSQSAQETDDNLMFVRNRLLKSEADIAALLDIYRLVRRGRRVPYEESNPLCAVLRLSGVVRVDQNRFRLRNRVYDHVFDNTWIRTHMPGAERRRQQRAFQQGVLRTMAFATVILGVVSWLAYRSYMAEQSATRAELKAQHERDDKADALYASQMLELQNAFEHRDYRRAVDLLEETASYPHRGFEWNYWKRLLGGEELSLKVPGPRTLMVWTRDGRSIATQTEADGGQTLSLWDAHTGKLVRTLPGRTVALLGVGSPVATDRVALVQAPRGTPGRVHVYDPGTGNLLFTLKEPAQEATLSGDGNRIFTLEPLTVQETNVTTSLAKYRPNGGWTRLKVWDAHTGIKLSDTLIPGPQRFGTTWGQGTVQSTPTSHRLLFGRHSQNGSEVLSVFDIGSGRVVWQYIDTDNQNHHLTCAIAPSGEDVAIYRPGLNDTIGILSMYSIVVQNHLPAVPLVLRQSKALWKKPLRVLRTMRFTPDGAMLIGVGGSEQNSYVWKWLSKDGSLVARHADENVMNVLVEFLEGHRYFLVSSADLRARIWDSQLKKSIATVTIDAIPPVASPEGTRFLTERPGNVLIYSAHFRNREERQGFLRTTYMSPVNNGNAILRVVQSNSNLGLGNNAIAKGEDVYLEDLNTRSQRRYEVGLQIRNRNLSFYGSWWAYRAVQRVAGKPLAGKLVVQGLDGVQHSRPDWAISTNNCWQIRNGRVFTEATDGHWKLWDIVNDRVVKDLGKMSSPIASIAHENSFSYTESAQLPDGRHRVHVIDSQTGEELWHLPSFLNPGVVATSIIVSNDNHFLATVENYGQGNNILTVYDRSCRCLFVKNHVLGYNSIYAKMVDFSPDGSRIAWFDGSYHIHITSVATGQEILPVTAPTDGLVSQFQWSAEGDRIAASSYNGGVTIHDARTGHVLLQLVRNYADADIRFFNNKMIAISENKRDDVKKRTDSTGYLYLADPKKP